MFSYLSSMIATLLTSGLASHCVLRHAIKGLIVKIMMSITQCDCIIMSVHVKSNDASLQTEISTVAYDYEILVLLPPSLTRICNISSNKSEMAFSSSWTAQPLCCESSLHSVISKKISRSLHKSECCSDEVVDTELSLCK